jgi:alpha-galactosidase
LRQLTGNAVAVGLFNRGDRAAEIGFRWDSLPFESGLLGSRRLQALDLWRHEAVPVTGDRYSVTVPPHAVVLLRVSPARGRGF